MEDHAPAVERHCDVAVIGGSAAGLAAALQISRQRRSVIVVDDGRPRNAPAAHMHGYLGLDGAAPADLVAAGRAEVRSYGGEIVEARVDRVTGGDGSFRVEIEGGHVILARRVVAATGVADVLPEIEGLAERWGRDVIHCPFCHGFEVRDRRIVSIITHAMGLHPATLFRQLSPHLTLVLHDGVAVDPAEVEPLRAAGVDVRTGVVRRLVTADSDPADPAGSLAAVEMDGGERIAADVVVVSPGYAARVDAFAPLGLRPAPHPSGRGDTVQVDATGVTDVPGLYAAGNVTDPSQQVLQAAANGSRVGAMVAFDLAAEDVRAMARPSGTEVDWDHRYGGDQVWSGHPNGTLVAEATELTPGRALDVGAGEGGDALWLAEQGWTVTACDISQRALDRVAAQAAQRGLSVTGLHADANALGAFAPAAFDLVSASYASIPRTPDGRAVDAILGAVAPGGTLLVIGHDLRARHEHGAASHGVYDADAYVHVEDFAAAVARSPEWEVQVHQTRPRPAGAVSTEHVEDEVLRARRVAG